MNMMTSLENIPLKTSSQSINDDSNDPLVKDILNEFNQEINNQPPPHPPPPLQPSVNDYIIQRPMSPSPSIQQPIRKTTSLYDEELLRKTTIITILIAFIFSPFIFNSFIEKLPSQFSIIINNYDFYIKLLIIFIIIYLLMIKKLI
jgi:hypothetical protein